jgi:UDP-3-O-[3-hydroxymyristoyl] glucosamine N-acyltransferase
MEFTVEQIAVILNGKIEGNRDTKVNRLEKIQEANQGGLSFLSNPKYESFIYTTKASAVIVKSDFIPKESVSATLIRVEDPYTSFSLLLEEYHKINNFSKVGIENPCFIGENSIVGDNVYRGAFSYIGNNCQIGKNVKIYPNVYIGDKVQIGDNTIIYAGVKIYADTVIGNYCTIQAGAVIGSDGFGFAPLPDGSYKTIPQIGNVVIEDHVDIGANTVIDCATMGSTLIKKGVKLDNLIQVGHNVEIGKNTVMAAQSGISGSAKLGEQCVIAGQAGIVGHISLANGTKIGPQSGIIKTVTETDKSWMGSPSTEFKSHMRQQAIVRKLPDILKRLEQLEEKVIHLPPLEK